MPVVIIVTDKCIPTIFEESTETALFQKINNTTNIPSVNDKKMLLGYLNCRPRPSGWYSTREEALEKIRVTAYPHRRPILKLQPKDIKLARLSLGMTRVAFGQALGFNGNSNTINKAVYQIETDFMKTLNRERQETLFALVAEYKLENGVDLDGFIYAGGGPDPESGDCMGPKFSIKISKHHF